MLLLGIDVGTSSIKVSVVDAAAHRVLASATHPERESAILVPQPGWAEQDPEQWWIDVQQAILKCHASGTYNPADIGAIGIAYQMHGLVLVDEQQQVLRPAIIWCDSRAVAIGNKAFESIGREKALSHLLNSPGNFTASKMAWVKEQEPSIYQKIYKAMLPGDFIAMKMTGETDTTISALSEAILWDFKTHTLSQDLLRYFEFSASAFPEVRPLFGSHGELKSVVAAQLRLNPGIPVAYKAGDQPNNALSLNVLQPGEVAATAGTSGVIYAVADTLAADQGSRINSFAHVNHTAENNRIGVLLNINGCGIMNRWIKDKTAGSLSYTQMNIEAAGIAAGSDGLITIPFGNGAERMLHNRIAGAHFINMDVNVHSAAHLYRSVQEGIAFAFRFGFDIMRENGIRPAVIRAGRANLFLSDVFAQAFADVNDVTVEFYEGDGSYGAAIGAGIGAGVYRDAVTAMQDRKPLSAVNPQHTQQYNDLYEKWKKVLQKITGTIN